MPSSNFRIKNKNKNKKNNNVKDSNTLENKHKQMINKIGNEINSLEQLKNKLDKIKTDLNKIEEYKKKHIIFDIEKRAKLLNLKDKYTQEIINIENNESEINYYDLTGDLLNDYYDLRKNTENNNTSKNILEFLNSDKKINDKQKSRAELFNTFCKRIDGVRINKDDGKNRIKYCSVCNVEKFLDYSKSSYICPNCGLMEFIIIDEDKQIKDYSPYQRRNHFKEWLNQFQAKETTDIPEDVFINIVNELNKNRITDLTKINRQNIQPILKKLGYNKLYEHIPFIINKISGQPAPQITNEIEEKFINMFLQIQEPWDLYKPKGRKNFLSYPYILYKFSELLELDDLLVYFPMLKPTKLMEQDIIWSKFCKHLKWEFYPTT